VFLFPFVCFVLVLGFYSVLVFYLGLRFLFVFLCFLLFIIAYLRMLLS